MLELHREVKMGATHVKQELSARSQTTTGTRNVCLQRLSRDCLKGWSSSSYSLVPCWEDEHEALQAKFDGQRRQWQAEMQADPTVAALANAAAAADAAAEAKAKAEKAAVEARMASRPWSAPPYVDRTPGRAAVGAQWAKKRWKGFDDPLTVTGEQLLQLSFPYSSRTIPPEQRAELDVMRGVHTTQPDRGGPDALRRVRHLGQQLVWVVERLLLQLFEELHTAFLGQAVLLARDTAGPKQESAQSQRPVD
jgi:hypothetical protein